MLYFLCYLDRSNLANAKTPISNALSLSTSQYGFASSIFQLGYILFEVPANIILKASPPGLWLGFLVASFGAIAASTAAAKGYASLVAIRIALGLAEAGFPPGVLYYISLWYHPDEIGQRNALFLVAGPLANALGAIIAYYVLQISGSGYAGWQWLFLIEGLPAVFLGLCLMAYLPSHPSSCRWLSEGEKALLARRVPMHAKDAAKEGHNWAHIAALFTSPVLWSFAFLNISTNIASYGIGAFLPAIIEELGYSSLEANLRTAPIYFWMACFNITIAMLSDRWAERGWVIVGCLTGCAAGMIGLALSIQLHWPLGVQYALMFSLVFYSAASPLMIAWLQKSYRSASDSSVGPALTLTIGSLGAFLGPNIYGTTSATNGGESFVFGHYIMAGVFAFGAILAAGMRLALYQRPGDGLLVVRPEVECLVSVLLFGARGSSSSGSNAIGVSDVDDGSESVSYHSGGGSGPRKVHTEKTRLLG